MKNLRQRYSSLFIAIHLILSVPLIASDEQHESEHEDTAPKNVGPNKGVLSFDEKNGLTLSPEAMKTFSIRSTRLSGSAPWTIPANALILSGEEVNVFRERSGVFKRIDVRIVHKSKTTISMNSEELKPGDSIVTQGAAYLRVAELDVLSGDSDHSH